MENNPFNNLDMSSLMTSWMKMATDSFQTTGGLWTDKTASKSETSKKRPEKTGKTQASLDSILKTWRIFSSTMGNPDTLQAGMSGISELPSVMMKMAQSSMTGFTRIQEQLEKRIKKTGESSGKFSFEQPDESFFANWKSIYEKEFQQYFNLPQLGLTRFHQEKANRAMDKFNLLQSTMGEFMTILFQPVERSFRTLQNSIEELSKQGELSSDVKTYYQMWIQILETEYGKLFISPEYLLSLGKTLSSLSEFSAAKEEVLQDLISTLPIPSQGEMDELYKELYTLRKRVRNLEKSDKA